ncbi:uncharacterized protein BN660_01889 [Clostridium sp. CAG:448]|nr:uncharacterized protein BN660_01889 [Clostridium sp. CAG:448]
MRKVHGEYGVPRLQKGKENGKVGVGAAVGLYVGVLCAEQTAGTGACELFHFVDIGTAAVIAFARITLGVFVGEQAPRSEQNRLGNHIFGGNQLNILLFALLLTCNGGIDLGVVLIQLFVKHSYILRFSVYSVISLRIRLVV